MTCGSECVSWLHTVYRGEGQANCMRALLGNGADPLEEIPGKPVVFHALLRDFIIGLAKGSINPDLEQKMAAMHDFLKRDHPAIISARAQLNSLGFHREPWL